MKVSFVTPRYGLSVTGGAEFAARQLAERLVQLGGWEVQVLTTCAVDHITWNDVFPVGESLINGVQVHRFASKIGRDPEFFALDGRLRPAPEAASYEDARRWVELQGPLNPEVVHAVSECGADVAVFYPYLYYPTVEGIRKVPMPAVLHPAAHDEPAFYLPVYRSTFRAADAIVYHSRSERQLVEGRYPVASRPQLLLGLGVDRPQEADNHDGDPLSLGDRPYVVSLGRVDAHKGSLMLAAFFRQYKERHPGPLALVMVGPVEDAPPEHPDIVVTGVVGEEDKWQILRNAVALISPSAFESFSLVAVEALAVSVPVLVNGTCGPTKELAERSGAGLWFDSYSQFEAALERLVHDPELRHSLGQAGDRYVSRYFEWSALIRRYDAFLRRVAGTGRMASAFVG